MAVSIGINEIYYSFLLHGIPLEMINKICFEFKGIRHPHLNLVKSVFRVKDEDCGGFPAKVMDFNDKKFRNKWDGTLTLEVIVANTLGSKNMGNKRFKVGWNINSWSGMNPYDYSDRTNEKHIGDCDSFYRCKHNKTKWNAPCIYEGCDNKECKEVFYCSDCYNFEKDYHSRTEKITHLKNIYKLRQKVLNRGEENSLSHKFLSPFVPMERHYICPKSEYCYCGEYIGLSSKTKSSYCKNC